ncbi:hypothetical protein [Algicella marina]|nr:hypothetical protein [Algicella marina]
MSIFLCLNIPAARQTYFIIPARLSHHRDHAAGQPLASGAAEDYE